MEADICVGVHRVSRDKRDVKGGIQGVHVVCEFSHGFSHGFHPTLMCISESIAQGS